MKITQTRRADQIVRTFDIEDGPVLPFPYSSAGKTFRVKQVTIVYRNHGNSPWEVEGIFSISITGPVLKKDGTEGKEIFNGRPESDALTAGLLSHYQWLRELIDLARPSGRSTALTIYEHRLEV